jgi:hypothetical protein
MMPDEIEPESDGKGILIIGGLIISGIIIAMMLKARQQALLTNTPPIPAPSLITIQQMQDRIIQLEQQIRSVQPLPIPVLTESETIPGISFVPVLAQRGGPDSEGHGFPLPTEEQSSAPASRNLIQYKDGSITDADAGQNYKNKESWVVKRDSEGAIIGVEVERNASVKG